MRNSHTSIEAAKIASYGLSVLGKPCDVKAIAIDAIAYERATDPLLLACLLAVKQRDDMESLEAADAAIRKSIRLKRTDIGEIHGKQVEQMQEVVAAKMADPFRRSVQETARRIAGRSDKPDVGRADKQAERIVKATFDLDKANREIFTAAAEVLPVVFAAGVMAELVILEALKGTKRTSAQEIAQRLEIDTSLLPFSIGQMPEWLLEAAREASGEAFAKDYWQEIGETTRDDIQIQVRNGIESGWSMQRVSKEIVEWSKDGDPPYDKRRAMLVARTETPNALLAGHSRGISQLEEETGFPIGKEWLSAFATFSRSAHKANDGKRTKDAKGMFTLNGVKIPWPAHTNLPAKDRCNCLCNIISTVSADGLEDVSQAAEAELTGEADLSKMPVQNIANNHLGLQGKLDGALDAAKKTKKQLDSAGKEHQAAVDAWKTQGNSMTAARKLESAGRLTEEQKELLEKERDKILQLAKVKMETKAKLDGLLKKQRADVLDSISIPKSQRTEVKGTKQKKGQPGFTSAQGRRESNGKFEGSYDDKMNESLDMVSRLLGKTDAQEIKFHSAKSSVRAFHEKGKGVFVSSHHPVDTFVHEVGHHIENNIPGVQKRAQEFLRHRTSGLKDINMNKTFKGFGYDKEETGNPDDFTKLFARNKKMGFGKAVKEDSNAASKAAYVGKNYRDIGLEDTEIMSMGFEMLHKDPLAFAERDPEFFKFTVGVLDGTIR